MNRYLAVLLIALAVFCLGALGILAQCGPGGCLVADNAAFQWKRSASDPDWYGLFRGSVQVGVWRRSTNEYRPIIMMDGLEWGEPCAPPIATPPQVKSKCPCCGEDCRCAAGKNCGRPDCKCVLAGEIVESDGTRNFGVKLNSICRGKHCLNGRECSKEAMMEAIGAPALTDDSTELCLTVIGNESDRKPVLDDLANSPQLAPWKGKLKIQGYDPSHWAVKDAGFVTNGQPTIYFQAADGKVLHRQDEYRGAEALAEALRNADPSYKSASDPDLNKTGIVQELQVVWKEIQTVPVCVWVAIAFVIYLRLAHREKLS